MKAGLGSKTPAWKAGSWLFGAMLLLLTLIWFVGLINVFRWFVWMLIVFLIGLAFTAPYALARMRGKDPYEPEPVPITPLAVKPGTYVAFLFFYRMPVSIGDRVYTAIWNAVGNAPYRRASESIPPSASEDWEVIGDRSDAVGSIGEAESTEYRVEIEQHLARVAQLRAKAREEGIDVGEVAAREARPGD